MPVQQKRVRTLNARSRRRPLSLRRRPAFATRELDSPRCLIAPAHSFTLPSLEGAKRRFEVSYGFEKAMPIAQALVRKGLLCRQHLDGAKSVVEALGRAMSDVVGHASRSCGEDAFSIDIRLSDRLEEGSRVADCLFFCWGNANETEYIPLRPIYEQLAGHPQQEQLMASLYEWLHQAAWQVFCGFGYREAECLYGWRREAYLEARASGEDVDLEGEIECSNPERVINYIRESERLKLSDNEIAPAIASIAQARLREAFEKAHCTFLVSRKIRLPEMSMECRSILDEAAYYMDGEPIPGLCISEWRDDPIVAWLDEFCQDQFNSGVTCRAPIVKCFRADDVPSFLKIIAALPLMAKTAFALSDWVRFAREIEDEYNNRNRG